MEVRRLVETHVACSVQSSSALVSTPLVDSSPPLVFVDLPLFWLVTKTSWTHRVLAIVAAQQVRA